MSNATLEANTFQNTTLTVNVADVEAHIAKVKAAWRQHEQGKTWEQKILVIERMRERDAHLARARQQTVLP